jgi:hypothetical protein
MCDMNNWVGIMLVNLPHFWDSFEDTDKEWDNQFESQSSKDKVCNSEGKKLIEFCERNAFGVLNGKYGSDTTENFLLLTNLAKV